MKELIKKHIGIIVLSIVAGAVYFFIVISPALALPSVQVLGEYTVSGGITATTSNNSNFTATGTIEFPALTGSSDCLTVNGTGVVSTSSCGALATSTDSADNEIIRWDGTGATTLQNSNVTISDGGNIELQDGYGFIFEQVANDIIVSASTSVTNGLLFNRGTTHLQYEFLSAGPLVIESWGLNDFSGDWFPAIELGSANLGSTSSIGFVLNTGGKLQFRITTGNDAVLDISQISTSDKVFTLPNYNGGFAILTATTTVEKGDMLVGQNSGGTFARLATSTDGYVLTASSTATNGVSWEASSGGGSGTAYNTLSFAVDPAGAATATSSPAGSNKKIGTSWTMHTLDYDGATQENAFWSLKFPAFTALNACTFTGTAFADSTTTSEVAVIGISHKPVGTSEAWTSSASTTASTTVSFLTAVQDFVNFSITVATSSIESADTLMVALARRPEESDDADTDDIRYANGKIICTYR